LAAGLASNAEVQKIKALHKKYDFTQIEVTTEGNITSIHGKYDISWFFNSL
jgi:hypothetical protein